MKGTAVNKNIFFDLSKEFLEYRLGVEATEQNVALFARHIRDFEQYTRWANKLVKNRR